ncbi:hypothetical protein [Exiguobacterium mexicanum]|uniref:hypothetical protein n=1 Tax=Exiguobacterium mexicanum TaxID=340146 RepID=UPI0037C0D21B
MAQKTRKTPVKRKRPATRRAKKKPIPMRTYGWIAFVLSITAFIFSLFDFGWVGNQTSLLATTLLGAGGH